MTTQNQQRPKKPQTVEEVYKKMTQLQHILLRPDTYVGSIEYNEDKLWVWDKQTQQIAFQTIKYVPGLYKIFDEILVNAADNYQRDKSMSLIKVEIRPEENMISVWNNGMGVPIEIHKEHNCYVPEMIFGQLLTSSNYDDDQKKVTGGRNGYGAKLANIFSTKFIVETGDSKTKKHYSQTFRDNMGKKEDPRIKDGYKGESFTKITFYPDLRKFNMDYMDDSIVSLFTKRVYDMAGISDSKVKVFLNEEQIQIKNFQDYIDLYLKADEHKDLPKIVEKKYERWEIACSLSDGQFQQVSFVNSICTSKGGTHVNYIADQIASKIMEEVKKKHKKLQIKPHHIKQNIWIFLNCLIENPAFDSQTKEHMNTKSSKFGSSVELTDKFLKQILNSGVVDSIVRVAQAKEEAKMARTLNQGKRAKLTGIPKLDDANNAGTRNGQDCTIILTEGDSAKNLAMSGLEIVGRDNYGVFPLRGKFLNVREATNKQIMENPEIQNLMKILGVGIGKTYEDTKTMRYGSVMIMTDQDHDGSHIKGLIINFIHHFWPSLLKMDGFMKEFVTPIIKVTKNNQIVANFFTIPEYEQWAETQDNLKGYNIKYYKGLGTSTAKEGKEYFSQIDKHQIDFQYQDEQDDESINLAFNKKYADKRKEWLKTYNKNLFVDHSQTTLRYSDFVNKELILFSVADCARSIPSLCDGLKPGQRKILFSCFKRKLKSEIKVAQLSGYVAEHSAYHHGEVSLQQTIVQMAQNFVGSNNINLLLPNGQFGSRYKGGADAASARYIFTMLSTVTRTLFPEDDDPVLDYLEEEGQSIEPEFYLPILPLCLVNGTAGIGTGWSTNITSFNVLDVIDNIKRMMRNQPYQDMKPWFKGFKGEIIPNDTNTGYIIRGIYNIISDDEFEITELPIGKWTTDYKQFLEELIEKNIIEDIREYHAENRVHFKVQCNNIDGICNGEGILKKFKLQTTLSMNNMVLFDNQGQICRYASPKDILYEFFGHRQELYKKRKEYMLKKIQRDYEMLTNKVRFILGVINEEIKVGRVKRQLIIKRLVELGFNTITQLNDILMKVGKQTKATKSQQEILIEGQAQQDQDQTKNDDDDIEVGEGEVHPKEYDYLLSMPIYSLVEEKVVKLQEEMQQKKEQYDKLEKMHIYEIWENDLDTFLQALEKHEEKEERERLSIKGRDHNKQDGKKRKRPAAPKKQKQVQDPNSPTSLKSKKPANSKKNLTSPSDNVSSITSNQKNKKQLKQQTQDVPKELTLRERLMLKAQENDGQIPVKTQSIFDNMDQKEAAQLKNHMKGIVGKANLPVPSITVQNRQRTLAQQQQQQNVSKKPKQRRRNVIEDEDESQSEDEEMYWPSDCSL